MTYAFDSLSYDIDGTILFWRIGTSSFLTDECDNLKKAKLSSDLL
jgi:hypothetical protein